MKNAGITLVALVITVIILLILAGIGMSMIVGGGGLLEKANDSKTLYEESAKNEKNILDEILNTAYPYSPDPDIEFENANDIEIYVLPYNLTNEKIQIKIVYDNNINWNKKDKFQYKIGENGEWQIANEVQTLIIDENITIYAKYYDGQKDYKIVGKELTKNIVKLGDYVEYTAGPEGQEYSYWRLVSNSDNDNVNLISDGIVSKQSFYGYNGGGAANTLNSLANNYKNDFAFSAKSVSESDRQMLMNTNTLKISAEYWIANRCYQSDPSTGGYYEGTKYISTDGNIYNAWTVTPGGQSGYLYTKTYGFRPIITLKSKNNGGQDIKITGGKGTKEEPWKLELVTT